MKTRGALAGLLMTGLITACGGGDPGGSVTGPPAEGPAAAGPAAAPAPAAPLANGAAVADPSTTGAAPAAAPPAAEVAPLVSTSDPSVQVAGAELAALAATAAAEPPAEKQVVPAPPDRRIEGQYIVTLREESGATPKSIEDRADRTVKRAGGGVVQQRFGKALQGYAATLTPDAARALLDDPDVLGVEEDQTVGVGAIEQAGASWGLDRIDQRALPLSTSYRYGATAANVTAYVLDTGIRATHAEFRSALGATTQRVRADLGFSAIADGRNTDDCNGHGTHVAGTIGGLNHGVAKQVTLVPVRVLGCSGSGALSNVLAGLDFVAKNARKPAVANLSLGGAASAAVDAAVTNLAAAGVPVVVAAGNGNADACALSPARAPAVISVGASTRADARAAFSNWGRCVALFAPGEAITSAAVASDVALAAQSGTSMAAPHAAGVAALLLGAEPTLTAAEVAERIKSLATPDRVTGAGTGSPTLLLFADAGEAPVAPPVTTPVTTPGTAPGTAPGTRPGTGARPLPAVPTKVVVHSLAVTRRMVDDASWMATVTIAVRTASGAPVAGARVFGGFSVGGNPLSCTTGNSGNCTVGTLRLRRSSTASTVFAVAGITGAGIVHDLGANALRQVTIPRP